jgi:hypothetical protein
LAFLLRFGVLDLLFEEDEVLCFFSFGVVDFFELRDFLPEGGESCAVRSLLDDAEDETCEEDEEEDEDEEDEDDAEEEEEEEEDVDEESDFFLVNDKERAEWGLEGEGAGEGAFG